jgi:hypothetical protein
MTTVLNVNLEDLNDQLIGDLKEQFGKTTQVELRLKDEFPADDLFSEADFWRVIEQIDWSKKASSDKLRPAVETLSDMPVSCIYLFADKLSEYLYHLDTRAHANAYAANEPAQFISADDFLYARCAVVAEGKEYYEKVLKTPTEMPKEIVFEPLLYLAEEAFERKMGVEFNYLPKYNYETKHNKLGWQ